MSVCHQVHATESQTRSWFWFSAYIHEPPTTCCWGKEEEDHSCWAWCPNKAMKFQSNAFESQHISSIYPVSFVYAVCKWTTAVSTAITRFSCRRDAGRWVAVKSARWTAGSQVGVCDRTLSDPKEWTSSFAVTHQICEPTHQRLSHFNKGSEGGNVNVFIRCRQTYDHLEQWPEGHLWPATRLFVTPKLLSFITCFVCHHPVSTSGFCSGWKKCISFSFGAVSMLILHQQYEPRLDEKCHVPSSPQELHAPVCLAGAQPPLDWLCPREINWVSSRGGSVCSPKEYWLMSPTLQRNSVS